MRSDCGIKAEKVSIIRSRVTHTESAAEIAWLQRLAVCMAVDRAPAPCRQSWHPVACRSRCGLLLAVGADSWISDDGRADPQRNPTGGYFLADEHHQEMGLLWACINLPPLYY